MLTEYDRNNIKFLLTASPEVLDDWYNTVPLDDMDYALEILKLFTSELEVKALDRLEEYIDPDFIDAKEIIQKVKNV